MPSPVQILRHGPGAKVREMPCPRRVADKRARSRQNRRAQDVVAAVRDACPEKCVPIEL